MPAKPSMASLQESDYGVDRDYAYGSPHLTHESIRARIESDLSQLVEVLITERGRCRALEVGAGHGSFTSVLVDAGATVTVTEMSEPSAEFIRRKFEGNPSVHVVYDPAADQGPGLVEQGCELIVFISVLHHIPNYVADVEALVRPLGEGGAFYSAQDPIWYPDRSRKSMLASRATYMMWRLRQGELTRGIKTQARRLRGVYDDTNPSDMVEYHVVRQGVNQKSLAVMLQQHFDEVEVRTYWSTMSGALQRLGERVGWQSEFALRATRRTALPRR